MDYREAGKMGVRKYFDIKTIVYILTIGVAGLFWIYTMNGVPARVSVLETKMEVIEKSIVKNETQMSLVLNAIYEIRGALLGSNSKKH